MLTAKEERIKPPDDKETARRVEALREKLAVVKGLEETGMWAEGLELAEATLTEAKAVDYAPVEAAALYFVGRLQERVGRYKAAAATLEAATNKASISHSDETAAAAIARLAFVVEARLSDPKGSLRWARLGEFAEHGSVVTTPTRAKRLKSMAGAFLAAGEYKKALEYCRRALDIYEKALGPEHPHVASVLLGMGIVFQEQGEYKKALEYYRRALDIHQKALGPEHPHVASALHNMGLVFSSQGEHEKALEYHRQALAIFEKALGPEHPHVGEALSGMGGVLLEQGRPQEAIELLERAVTICEKKACDRDEHGQAFFALIRALVATNGDKERAVRLAEQALDVFGKLPKYFKKELIEVNAWLQEHGDKN